LSEVAASIAYRAVRNRGTIGGSLAHADPAADWPVALAALGTTVNLQNAQGVRALGVDSFVLGAFSTALAEDEIIESIDVPKLSAVARCGYFKFSRKTGDFAEANAAAVFDPEKRIARLFLGAMRRAPVALAGLASKIAAEGQGAATHESVVASLAVVIPDLESVERRMGSAVILRVLSQALQR
jgi:carbon-monoxide dehydrogenase medium subunit